jgi:hypothetical protein
MPLSLRLPLLLCLFVASAAFGNPPEPLLAPHVDPRVELVSIVFRLTSENWDYNKNFLKPYASDIDSYFSPYKEHPAVLLAKKLAEKEDFDLSAPMQIAVRLSPPPALQPLLAFNDNVPGAGFDKPNALLFAQNLRDFYRDTHFDKFLAAHEAMYRVAEERFRTVMRDVDLSWYESFYGQVSRSNFNLILGMNNGGSNYGAQFTSSDGHEERFSIIGAWTADASGNPTYDNSYLDEVIHEFNHSFVNPAFDRHKNEFAPAQKVYEQVAAQMRGMAYANADEMVYESLVRGNVILYLESHGRSRVEIQRKIREQQKKGFLWMDELYPLLREYGSQRSRYPSFDSFMPVVAQFYRELAPRIAELKTSFFKNYVHVTGMQPFVNHAQGVDPGVKEIVFMLDKALSPCCYSINAGPGGMDHYPITGNPEFLPGDRSIKVKVVLKPDWHYSFVLTDESFISPDGFPLEPYAVDFDTKR